MRFEGTTVILLLLAAVTAPQAGVVVDGVTPIGTGARAGIEKGDLLTSWYRKASDPTGSDAEAGELRSPVDLAMVEIRHEPRGTIVLLGERSGTRFEAELAPGPLGISSLPRFSPDQLDRYRVALETAKHGAPGEAAERFDALLDAVTGDYDHRTEAWLFVQAHKVMARETPESNRFLNQAIDLAKQAHDFELASWIMENEAESCLNDARLDEAKEWFLKGLHAHERNLDEDLLRALLVHGLGIVEYYLGDPDRAGAYWQQAMVLRQRLAPGSLVLADSLNNLALLATEAGDLDRSSELNLQCLAIRQQLAPNGFQIADTFTNLGNAVFLNGDMAAAEQYQRKAMAIREELMPDSLELATSYFNIGGITLERGDLESAAYYIERSLDIRRRRQPDGPAVAGSLDGLATVCLRLGEIGRAEELNREALALFQKLAPQSRSVAAGWTTHAMLALQRGRITTAEESLRKAIAILEVKSPESFEMAIWLSKLGSVIFQLGRIEEAEKLQRRALEKIRSVSPGGSTEAESLYELARVHSVKGEPAQAIETMRQAIDCLETQVEMLGGATERRAGFRQRYMEMYREALRLHVQQGLHEEAFAILERSLAHAQLAMLAEHDLMFTADIPVDLERRRRRVAAESDRVLSELGWLRAWAPGRRAHAQRGIGALATVQDNGETDGLLERLQELRRQQEDIRALIRDASPRLAALAYPSPVDLQKTLSILDPGSVLLVYSLAEESSYLFVVDVDREILVVLELAVGESQLRSTVMTFREQLRQDRAFAGSSDLARQAAELSELLLVPARESIERAERLLIVADGPLHYLPFAALDSPIAPRTGRSLIEERPFLIVPSATVFAEIKKNRHGRQTGRIVAFADPTVSPQASRSAQPGSVAQSLGRLPGSRVEVQALRETFGAETSVWMDGDASEARVKEQAPTARILHLAVHGIVNQQRPMESALLLAGAGGREEHGDNGVLQVWEIYDQLRLDADLVTLSSCESALGSEMSGEGLMGLIQAFQYAGARSVLASLWSISDSSTAELMRAFYRNIKNGAGKHEALRAAQLELIRGSFESAGDETERRANQLRHPFYWAAFQLYGDWL